MFKGYIETNNKNIFFRRVFIMKRKALALLTATAMLASLVGCGGSSGSGSDDSGSDSGI